MNSTTNVRIQIEPSDRVCFFGRTGSGKTTMIRRLLRITNRWVFLDNKYGFTFAGVPTNATFDPGEHRQIIRLPEGESHDPIAWMKPIRAAYESENIVIVIDELTGITRPQQLPSVLDWAVKTGRQRNVAVWSATQRPMLIPSSIYTEAEHFFVFNLARKQDREKIVDFTTDEIEPHIQPYHEKLAPKGLQTHDALYYRVGGDWLILRA